MRSRVNAIKYGRFDMEIHIVDESGELVAICKHCAVVVEGRWLGSWVKSGSCKVASKMGLWGTCWSRRVALIT
jgi:hypothetical protein